MEYLLCMKYIGCKYEKDTGLSFESSQSQKMDMHLNPN